MSPTVPSRHPPVSKINESIEASRPETVATQGGGTRPTTQKHIKSDGRKSPVSG